MRSLSRCASRKLGGDPAGESPAQVTGSVLLGSECCVATGDSGCEAYTAIAWGVGLSHERLDIAGAESFYSLEGNMCGTAMALTIRSSATRASAVNLKFLSLSRKLVEELQIQNPH